MSVPVAYVTMLLVWSTTPLGIAWSSEDITPVSAITARMVLAALLGWVLLKVLGIKLSWDKKAIRAYTYSLLGIYAAMLCTYLAAGSIPTGLISVMFATSPVLSGLFSKALLKEGGFTRIQAGAYTMSFVGLILVCQNTLSLTSGAGVGVVLMLAAVALYSLSGVLVQKTNYEGHPLSMSVGGLIISSPFFLVTWYFTDGVLPEINWEGRSFWSILYLAVCGSLIGFMSYYKVLQAIGATAVATVTLATPVLALLLGVLLNGESITPMLALGTSAILFGLVVYFQGEAWISKLKR